MNMINLTMEDIENIILGMAEIVHENRYLRKRNDELELEVSRYQRQINETYKSTQRSTANLISAALSNAHFRAGDFETAERLADKIV